MKLSLLRNNASYWLIIISISLFKLWLIAEFPIVGETFAGHDDRHFVDQANSLLQGQWLGTYNQYTLIKGPGYPFWLAILAYSKIPLLTAQSAFYGFGCLGVSLFIKKTTQRSWLAALVFGIQLLYFDTYPRVARESLYTPLTFNLLVALLWCYYFLLKKIISLSLR